MIHHKIIPILKLESTEIYGQKKLDLTISTTHHTGMKAAELINEFHSEFKEFKGLALVLKYILSEINLLNPYIVSDINN